MKIDFIFVTDNGELADQVSEIYADVWGRNANHENAGDAFIITDSIDNQPFLNSAFVNRLPAVIITREESDGSKIALGRLMGYVPEAEMEAALIDALNGNEIESFFYNQDGEGIVANGSEGSGEFGLFDFKFPRYVWLALTLATTYGSIKSKGIPKKVLCSVTASYSFTKFIES